MNIFGIGPILAIVGGIGFLIVVTLHQSFGIMLSVPSPWRQLFVALGVFFCAAGLYFWLSSIYLIGRAFRVHRLETSGAYRFSRNPMYAAFIVFLIPGVGFIFNNLLILCISLSMYAAFKMLISREEECLRRIYGARYEEYERNVAQLIPFVKV